MRLKELYAKTKYTLTSPDAKKFYKGVGVGLTKVGKYSTQVSRNLDNTFAVPQGRYKKYVLVEVKKRRENTMGKRKVRRPKKRK